MIMGWLLANKLFWSSFTLSVPSGDEPEPREHTLDDQF